MSKYEAVIGLEIHAELKTETKMFCGCKNETFVSGDMRSAISATPNVNICPVCIGMPGTLPVLNKQAIEMTVKTGLALNCQIAKFTKWDRKNYFYPDLPKGYQISQYDLPICHSGHIEISNDQLSISKQASKLKTQNPKRIRITRIHLEEDTGTSKHPEGRAEVDYSLLDYNRSGVPLMELVTEPDITTAQEAKEFCKAYQLILRTLGVADADMEKGQMRCEANISLRELKTQNSKLRTKLGTKVEVKNLNSFKAVERAIEYEIERQTEVLESGEKVIQETRGWDDRKSRTYTMRVKETSADYRYFPEPDLPPVKITDNEIEQIKKQLPEMPEEKIKRYIKKYKLLENDAKMIANNRQMAKYLESCIMYKASSIKQLANFIINEVPDLSIKAKSLVELVNMIEKGKISGKMAKEVLPEMKKGKSPEEIIKSKGLSQISDTGKLKSIIDKVIKVSPDAVAKIKSGQAGVMGFLVGQVMLATKGQANPKIVNEILRKKISQNK